MFNLVISRHQILRDFTTIDLTCIAVPPIWLVLSEPHIFFLCRADIALIGLAVMGQNLILNMNDHGFVVRITSLAEMDRWIDVDNAARISYEMRII